MKIKGKKCSFLCREKKRAFYTTISFHGDASKVIAVLMAERDREPCVYGMWRLYGSIYLNYPENISSGTNSREVVTAAFSWSYRLRSKASAHTTPPSPLSS